MRLSTLRMGLSLMPCVGETRIGTMASPDAELRQEWARITKWWEAAACSVRMGLFNQQEIAAIWEVAQ